MYTSSRANMTLHIGALWSHMCIRGYICIDVLEFLHIRMCSSVHRIARGSLYPSCTWWTDAAPANNASRWVPTWPLVSTDSATTRKARAYVNASPLITFMTITNLPAWCPSCCRCACELIANALNSVSLISISRSCTVSHRGSWMHRSCRNSCRRPAERAPQYQC